MQATFTALVPPTDDALLAIPGRSVFDPETGAWRRDLVASSEPRRRGPMLARTFGEVEARFPCAAQPKIDGVRALLDRSGLVTRGGEVIVSLPELTGLGALLPDGVTLDGELTLRGGTLEEISAVVRTRVPHRRRRLAIFHVFDGLFDDRPRPDEAGPQTGFRARWIATLGHLWRILDTEPAAAIEPVTTPWVETPEAAETHYHACLAEGFEGQILRDPDAPYVHGRTAALIKRKPWNDAEGAFVRLVAGKRTGLPRACIVRDLETGEMITVAVPALSAEERRRLAANPPATDSLVGYRWQATHSTHRRHCTLVRFYGPEGRL